MWCEVGAMEAFTGFHFALWLAPARLGIRREFARLAPKN